MGVQPPPIIYILAEGVNYLTLRVQFHANECNEGEMLTPNPNECNSTLTSGTKNIYPYIDLNDRGHRLRSGSPVTNLPGAAEFVGKLF